MTSVLRVEHLEHERLVMEFLKKIAATCGHKKAGQRPLGSDQQVSFKLLKLTIHQPRGSHRSDH
jgi:hypothetical protein